MDHKIPQDGEVTVKIYDNAGRVERYEYRYF